MFNRGENGKLRFEDLDFEIMLDDWYSICTSVEELQWILNKIAETAYQEAMSFGEDQGFDVSELDISF